MRACKAHSNGNFVLTRKYVLNLYLNVWEMPKRGLQRAHAMRRFLVFDKAFQLYL
jgi:hypothetical protein